MKRVSPLGALARGVAAGAAGSAVVGLFFEATAKIAPQIPEGAFEPPEPAQKGEGPTETVARRFVEGLMQRGPLDPDRKKTLGSVVHFAFGATWGGLYGIARESLPAMNGPLGAIVFGSTVWAISDDVILPAFRVGPPANRTPLALHAYALTAHLVYGASVSAIYEALRPRSMALALATLRAARTHLALSRRLPAAARPVAHAAVSAAAKVRARRPMATVAQALQAF